MTMYELRDSTAVDDLAWSPTDSQSQLLGLIDGAQHSLDVEELEFGDTALVDAIVAAADRGVFAGSENFSDNSLKHNRELGLIIDDSGVLGGIESTFDTDFAGGTPFGS